MEINYRIEASAESELTKEQVEKVTARLAMDWDNGNLVRYMRFAILQRRQEMKRLADEIKEYEDVIATIRKVDPENQAFQAEEL